MSISEKNLDVNQLCEEYDLLTLHEYQELFNRLKRFHKIVALHEFIKDDAEITNDFHNELISVSRFLKGENP